MAVWHDLMTERDRHIHLTYELVAANRGFCNGPSYLGKQAPGQ